MNKIIYLNKNLQTREVEIEELERFQGHLFIEDAFVICVICNGIPLAPIVADLTALERYAMASNGFDYLSLQDKDFRLSNTFFKIDYREADQIQLYLKRTYYGQDSEQNEPLPAPKLATLVPVFKKMPNLGDTVVIDFIENLNKYQVRTYNGETEDFLNEFFAINKVVQIGGLFLKFSNKTLSVNEMVFINPKTNEFSFSNYNKWEQVHLKGISFSSAQMGYILQFMHTSGDMLMISTTPIDDDTQFVFPVAEGR